MEEGPVVAAGRTAHSQEEVDISAGAEAVDEGQEVGGAGNAS